MNLILYLVLSTLSFAADNSNFTFSGKITEDPRRYESADKSTENYTFKVQKNDGFFVEVRFYTKDLNYSIAAFNYKKGDNFSATGIFTPPVKKILEKYLGFLEVNKFDPVQLSQKFGNSKITTGSPKDNPTSDSDKLQKELFEEYLRESEKVSRVQNQLNKGIFPVDVQNKIESHIGCKLSEAVKLKPQSSLYVCGKNKNDKTQKVALVPSQINFDLLTFVNSVPHGTSTSYRYHDLKIYIEGEWNDGRLLRGKYFHPNGKVYNKFSMLSDLVGEDELFFPDGTSYARMRIHNKLHFLDGEQILYYPSGKKLAVVVYDKKKAVKEEFFKENGDLVKSKELAAFVEEYQNKYISREFEASIYGWLVTFYESPSAIISPTLSKEYREKRSNYYLSRVRQTEAKIRLASLYTALKAFYAEYSSYSTDFHAIGVYADDRSDSKYFCGFAQPYAGKIDYPKSMEYDPNRMNDSFIGGFSKLPLKDLAAKFPKDAVVTATGFKVACVGKISDSGKFDIWTIDDKKNMINVQSGL